MEIIPVTPELTVELENTRWRLVQDHDNGKSLRVLVDANVSQILFHVDFVIERHLQSAKVGVDEVARVVLGWTPESQSWQLGLFLKPRVSSSNELIWCELIRWSGANPSHGQIVGKALSQVINSSFQIVGTGEQLIMSDVTQPSMQTNPLSVPTVATQPLPIQIGDWTMRAAPQGLAWQLTRRWVTRHLLQSAFFALVTLIFILLGIGALQSGLAAVSPEWLPYISFGVAAVLAFSAVENLWQLFTRQQIVIDDEAQEVRSERALTGVVSWRVPYDAIDYILVSQEVASPQGRRSRNEPMEIAQDVWVHLSANGEFYLVSEQEDAEGKSWQWEIIRRRAASPERYPLDLTEYDTPLHHAVKKMADRLSVPALVDIR